MDLRAGKFIIGFFSTGLGDCWGAINNTVNDEERFLTEPGGHLLRVSIG